MDTMFLFLKTRLNDKVKLFYSKLGRTSIYCSLYIHNFIRLDNSDCIYLIIT